MVEGPRWARNVLFASVAGVLALAAERPAHGSEPIVDDAVLARVPARDLEQQRAAVKTDAERVQLARAYIDASRREGDPRYLGAAEGLLVGLKDVEAHVLRATILQSRHEFAAALVELEGVHDEQAALTRATVLTVLAEYDRARESCSELPALYRVACEAPIDALTGRQEQARAELERAIKQAPQQRAWLLSLLGEQAYWLGDARAEAELRASLAIEDDRYTRAVLADLLLDAGKYREVAAMRANDDAMALRVAIAKLALGERADDVEGGFAASRARGDSVHRREEARYWLARGDRAQALACALESWRAQREPWDARVVLESANNQRDAAPVLAWMQRTGFASPRLRALAAELKP